VFESCTPVVEMMMDEKRSMPYILKRSKQEFEAKKRFWYIKHLAGYKAVRFSRTV
jgi:hypothetical protein